LTRPTLARITGEPIHHDHLKKEKLLKPSCTSDEPELDSGSGGTAPDLIALSPLHTTRIDDLGDVPLWKEQYVILKQPRLRCITFTYTSWTS
jgi:hypothetical protein